MISVPIPHNSQAPTCTRVILALIGLLLPLQTMAAQTSSDVPYVVVMRGTTDVPADVQKLLMEVSQAEKKKTDAEEKIKMLEERIAELK